MGLDFSKTKTQQPIVAEPVVAEPAVVVSEPEVVQYDIVADRQQLNEVLVNSPEVDAIVSTGLKELKLLHM